MEKILVVSDIHYPTRQKNPIVLNKLENLIKEVDIVIGCGDYVSENILYLINSVAKKSYLVKGNMDFFDNKIPEKLIVKIENLDIGIIHGEGAPFGIENRIIKKFEKKPDIIFFGHTHFKQDKYIDNIRFINPGAFCDAYYCLANILDKEIKVQFCRLS